MANALHSINEVTPGRLLVLEWVTFGRRVTISICNQPPKSNQPGHLSLGRRTEYQRKLRRKQAYRVIHYQSLNLEFSKWPK